MGSHGWKSCRNCKRKGEGSGPTESQVAHHLRVFVVRVNPCVSSALLLEPLIAGKPGDLNLKHCTNPNMPPAPELMALILHPILTERTIWIAMEPLSWKRHLMFIITYLQGTLLLLEDYCLCPGHPVSILTPNWDDLTCLRDLVLCGLPGRSVEKMEKLFARPTEHWVQPLWALFLALFFSFLLQNL